MNRKAVPLISLGPFPPGMLEDLGEVKQGFNPIEIPEPEFQGELGPFLLQLDSCSSTLPDGPIVVLCPSGSEFRRRLGDAIARLYRARREIHLVLPLPFGFEGASGSLSSETVYWCEFLCRSITLLDGQGLVSRLPRKTTIKDLFRIQAAKLAHLLADMRLVLGYPRHTYVRRSLVGDLVWEGTWPSQTSPVEHLATLMRNEAASFEVVVCHGVKEPKRLLRMPRRLGMEPFLLCQDSEGGETRLGGFGKLEEQIGRGVEARKRGPKPDPAREERQEREKVERQLARAKEENRQLRLIIAAQKKIAELFPESSATDE